MLIKCPGCHNDVSKNAHICPHCGEPIKPKGEGRCRSKAVGFVGIALFICGFGLPYVFQDSAIPIMAVGVGSGILLAAIGFSSASATND